MKTRIAVGLLAGLSLMAASLAHAILGWPQFDGPLAGAGVDPQLVAGLSVGWYYGSFTMAGFGLIVVLAAWSGHRRGTAPGRAPVVVGIVTLAFGLWAFVSREMNPHFGLFIAQGILVLFYSRTGT